MNREVAQPEISAFEAVVEAPLHVKSLT